MPAKPKITYFLYDLKNSISSNHPLWKSPLPQHRNASRHAEPAKSGVPVNYGDYFQAVRGFLEKNHCNITSAAVSRQIERTINPEEIREIRVCLEKHGAFYHPARIDVLGADFSTKFVLNVALSRAGRDWIQKEYASFEKLNHVIQGHFLPSIYGKDDIALKKDLKLGMFLGEWFEGFHEFHLSRDPLDNTLKIKVWDPERGGFYLSEQQCRELYRQAARILTSCYNVETTEHIFSWHHASGDFIVKLENSTVDVKLITVRRYESALKNDDRNAESLMNALLVFFLHLTIRMRLDRLDGTGELVWSDDIAVPGSVLGFLEGLAQKPGIDILPGPIDSCFMAQIANYTQSDLLDISRTILNAYSPQAPEVPLIRQHLHKHMVVLRQVINDFGGSYNFKAWA
jgi:hypothetical protein